MPPAGRTGRTGRWARAGRTGRWARAGRRRAAGRGVAFSLADMPLVQALSLRVATALTCLLVGVIAAWFTWGLVPFLANGLVAGVLQQSAPDAAAHRVVIFMASWDV
jgi:hypothetical protein